MQKKTIALSALLPVKKAGKIEYVIANISYGDYRKDEVAMLLTGTLVIADNGDATYDEKANKLCRHIKVKDVKNFDFEAAQLKSHDGYIVCEEKNIPALTKAIQAFYSNAKVIELGFKNPFTLLHTCEQFTGDTTVKATAKAITNELVPAV
jgi:hypothetical protein